MPYVSQVIFGNQIKIDLTNDTVTPETVKEGYTFHAANGEPMIGTYKGGGGENVNLDIQIKDISSSRMINADTSYVYPPVSGEEQNILFTRYGISNALSEVNNRVISLKNCYALHVNDSINGNSIIDISQAEDCSYMFYNSSIYCSDYNMLDKLKLSSKNLLSTAYMFAHSTFNFVYGTYTNIRYILNIPDYIANTSGMFRYLTISRNNNYGKIIGLKIPNNAKNISHMFENFNIFSYNLFDDSDKKKLFEIPNGVIDASYLYAQLFDPGASYVSDFILPESVLSSAYMFVNWNFYSMQNEKLAPYTNNLINISGMFYNCRGISVDSSLFKSAFAIPENVEDASYLFYDSVAYLNNIKIINGIIDPTCTIHRNNLNMYSMFNTGSFINDLNIIGNNLNCGFLFGSNGGNVGNLYIEGNNICIKGLQVYTNTLYNYNVKVSNSNYIDLSYLFYNSNFYNHNLNLSINNSNIGINLSHIFEKCAIGIINNLKIYFNFYNKTDLDASYMFNGIGGSSYNYFLNATNIYGNNLNFYKANININNTLNNSISVKGNNIICDYIYSKINNNITTYDINGNNISFRLISPGWSADVPFNQGVKYSFIVNGNNIDLSYCFDTYAQTNVNYCDLNFTFSGSNINIYKLACHSINNQSFTSLSYINNLNINIISDNTQADYSFNSFGAYDSNILINSKTNSNFVYSLPSASYYNLNLYNYLQNCVNLYNVNLYYLTGSSSTLENAFNKQPYINMSDINISGEYLDLYCFLGEAQYFNNVNNFNIICNHSKIDVYNPTNNSFRNLRNIYIKGNNIKKTTGCFTEGNNKNILAYINNSTFNISSATYPNKFTNSGMTIIGNQLQIMGGYDSTYNFYNTSYNISGNGIDLTNAFRRSNTFKYSGNINITGQSIILDNTFSDIYNMSISKTLHFDITDGSFTNAFYNLNFATYFTGSLKLYCKNCSGNKTGMFYKFYINQLNRYSIHIYCNNANEFIDYNLIGMSDTKLNWTPITNGYVYLLSSYRNNNCCIYVYNNYNPA